MLLDPRVCYCNSLAYHICWVPQKRLQIVEVNAIGLGENPITITNEVCTLFWWTQNYKRITSLYSRKFSGMPEIESFSLWCLIHESFRTLGQHILNHSTHKLEN